MTTRVLIVEDHRLFADAIRSALDDEEGMQVLEVARNGAAGLAAAREHDPDLALVDLGLPDMEGVEVGRTIAELSPDTRVVAVTSYNDAEIARRALEAGFHGFLTKDTPIREFVGSLRAVLGGQTVIPSTLVRGAAGVPSAEERDAALLAGQLTARERTVLGLLVEGVGNAQMAARLTLSPNTVRTHIQNILGKLQVHSRLEAAAFAVRHGVVKVHANTNGNGHGAARGS